MAMDRGIPSSGSTALDFATLFPFCIRQQRKTVHTHANSPTTPRIKRCIGKDSVSTSVGKFAGEGTDEVLGRVVVEVVEVTPRVVVPTFKVVVATPKSTAIVGPCHRPCKLQNS